MYKLREIERKDIKTINLWRNDENIIASLGAPYRFINQEVDERWFDNYMQNRTNSIRCAIVDDKNNEIIGLISLMEIDYINRSAKLHIMIGTEGQGKGAGTFAIKKIIEHAFNNYGLHRIELDVLSDNKRAMHVYEKCGFIREGVRRQAVYKDSEYKDMFIYSIIN